MYPPPVHQRGISLRVTRKRSAVLVGPLRYASAEVDREYPEQCAGLELQAGVQDRREVCEVDEGGPGRVELGLAAGLGTGAAGEQGRVVHLRALVKELGGFNLQDEVVIGVDHVAQLVDKLQAQRRVEGGSGRGRLRLRDKNNTSQGPRVHSEPEPRAPLGKILIASEEEADVEGAGLHDRQRRELRLARDGHRGTLPHQGRLVSKARLVGPGQLALDQHVAHSLNHVLEPVDEPDARLRHKGDADHRRRSPRLVVQIHGHKRAGPHGNERGPSLYGRHCRAARGAENECERAAGPNEDQIGEPQHPLAVQRRRRRARYIQGGVVDVCRAAQGGAPAGRIARLGGLLPGLAAGGAVARAEVDLHAPAGLSDGVVEAIDEVQGGHGAQRIAGVRQVSRLLQDQEEGGGVRQHRQLRHGEGAKARAGEEKPVAPGHGDVQVCEGGPAPIAADLLGGHAARAEHAVHADDGADARGAVAIGQVVRVDRVDQEAGQDVLRECKVVHPAVSLGAVGCVGGVEDAEPHGGDREARARLERGIESGKQAIARGDAHSGKSVGRIPDGVEGDVELPRRHGETVGYEFDRAGEEARSEEKAVLSRAGIDHEVCEPRQAAVTWDDSFPVKNTTPWIVEQASCNLI